MKNILIGLFMTIALAACNTGNTPFSTSPGKSVESMMNLLNKGEVQESKKFLNPMPQAAFAPDAAKRFAKDGLKSLEAKEQNSKGDTADVVLTMETVSGYQVKLGFDMLRDNGQWVATNVTPLCELPAKDSKDKKLPC